jgi:site-specific recombinase XerD
MSTSERESNVVQIQIAPPDARVGQLAYTAPVESYFKRAYTLFGGGLDGADVVVLLEMFFTFKVGNDGNSPESGKQAIVAIVSFLEHCKTAPWLWQPQHLQQYVAAMKFNELAAATIRSRHHYIKDFCVSILADRPVANKILSRHPGGNFQQIADEKSRALVKGARKSKKVLTCPTPEEMKQVFDWFENEIVDAYETKSKSLYPLLRDQAIVTILYAYGLRSHELRAMNLSDFDFNPETPEFGNYGLLHVIGKGNRQRTLPIVVPGAYEFIKNYVHNIRPHWVSDGGIDPADRDAMFFSDERNRVSKTTLERSVKKRFRQAGITRNVSPHRMRDVFVTNMVETIGLVSASDLVGHSFTHTTEGYFRPAASTKGDALTNHIKKVYKQRSDNE